MKGDYISIGTPSGWSTSGDLFGFVYGNNKAILLNENNGSSISSTITGLTPGMQYTLTFDYWGDNVYTPVASNIYGFNVNVGGAVTSFDPTVHPGFNGTSNTASITFTPTDSSTTVALDGIEQDGDLPDHR